MNQSAARASAQGLRIGLVGASGRMGQEVEACLGVRDSLSLKVGRSDGCLNLAQFRTAETLLDQTDVLIDFSLPDVATVAFEVAAKHKIPVVSGTTGWTNETRSAFETLKKVCPVVWAPNFSQGVTLLFHLAELAARAANFDAEIVEAHHKHKVDAPSGTAMRLWERVKRGQKASGRTPNDSPTFGRNPSDTERKRDEIAIHSVRGGSVVGEHRALFFGEMEQLEIRHTAESRRIFAEGAMLAARWVASQPHGAYDMEDVMGLA